MKDNRDLNEIAGNFGINESESEIDTDECEIDTDDLSESIIEEASTTPMPDDVFKALNEQVKNEFEAFYAYYGMANSMDSIGFKGMACWLRKSAKEELNHAYKVNDYILERGKDVKLIPIQPSKEKWNTPKAAFESANKHEISVTANYNNLKKLAESGGDHQTCEFINFFLREQTEEEDKTFEICQKLDKAGNDPAALLQIDNHLGC